jgi:hypothetical protein
VAEKAARQKATEQKKAEQKKQKEEKERKKKKKEEEEEEEEEEEAEDLCTTNCPSRAADGTCNTQALPRAKRARTLQPPSCSPAYGKQITDFSNARICDFTDRRASCRSVTLTGAGDCCRVPLHR